jgi:HSP20 family molecular chaperone IbpA
MVGQVAAGPSAAIEEGEREVVVRLALGWVVHGSVRVSCTPQTLVVEAERCARPGDAVAAGARREGTALRCVVPLPAAVKAGSARARFARGELTVHLALAGARPS